MANEQRGFMKSLAKVMFLLGGLVSNFSLAEGPREPGGKNVNFENHKQEMLQNLDERIALLQTEKNCLSAAKEQGDAKKCREQADEKQKEIRLKKMEHQKQKLDEEMKKLKEKK